ATTRRSRSCRAVRARQARSSPGPSSPVESYPAPAARWSRSGRASVRGPGAGLVPKERAPACRQSSSHPAVIRGAYPAEWGSACPSRSATIQGRLASRRSVLAGIDERVLAGHEVRHFDLSPEHANLGVIAAHGDVKACAFHDRGELWRLDLEVIDGTLFHFE